MAMDAFDRADVIDDVKNLRDKFAQVRSSAQVVVAKAAEIVALKAKWVANAELSAEVAKLDAAAAGLVAFAKAAGEYLKG